MSSFSISKGLQSGLATILAWLGTAASIHYNEPAVITVVTEIVTLIITVFHIHVPNTDTTTNKGSGSNG